MKKAQIKWQESQQGLLQKFLSSPVTAQCFLRGAAPVHGLFIPKAAHWFKWPIQTSDRNYLLEFMNQLVISHPKLIFQKQFYKDLNTLPYV